MSQWTHIAGSIRIDVGGSYISAKKYILNVLGHQIDFETDDKLWKTCKLPLGSEGSLRYKIVQTGKQEIDGNITSSDLSAFNILIWGDLRDFGDKTDIKKIDNWVKDIVKQLNWPEIYKNGIGIRQLILSVDIESGKNIVYKKTIDMHKKLKRFIL